MADPFSTSVAGSRYPLYIPVKPISSTPTQKPKPLRLLPPPTPVHDSNPMSAIRRKPVITFKAPSSHNPNPETTAFVRRSQQKATKPASVASNSAKSTTSESISSSSVSKPRPVALPLYHPKGPLALSLPQLDPAIFGLPNPVSVDDQELAVDEATRRPSSRARRPAAKVRDRDREEAEQAGRNGTETNGHVKQTSPRKRRAGAGGAGGGGGGKRRKKDMDDADGTYPQPAVRRTRNARNTSTIAAAAAAYTMENDDTPNIADMEDTAPPQNEMSTRSDRRGSKPRAPTTTKRGTSSASDGTAAPTMAAPRTERDLVDSEKTPDEPAQDVEMEVEDQGEKVENSVSEEEKIQDIAQRKDLSVEDTAAEITDAMQVDEPTISSTVLEEPSTLEAKKPPPSASNPAIMAGEPTKEFKGVIAEPEDEKEEGELSESTDRESMQKS